MIKQSISKIIKKELSNSEQNVLNVVGAILVVIINTCINFFLSPFITEHLGVEANGYITLANNFISYFGLITTALNSMCGRFMLIAIRKDDYDEANGYYSSVLFADWILAAVLFVPVLALIIKLDCFIQVSTKMLTDVKILFSLLFLNFFLSLCLPKWENATYSTNRLYLRSIKTAITTVIRALLIFIAYSFFPPYTFYVALAGFVATSLNFIIEYNYKVTLLPRLSIRKKNFDWEKVKILISSGIWNTVSQCGHILLEGIDVLVANIFINPTMSGALALSKIIPNMLTQIVGTIGTTFGPSLTALYADQNFDEIARSVKMQIKIVALIASIPIGGTFVLGIDFFSLWVPSQNAYQLWILSSLTLFGMLFSGVSNCIINIFTATNKLKYNSLIVIATGLLNIGIVYILLKTTSFGVYAIAGVSSFVTIARSFLFVAPYAAKCINKKKMTFVPPLIKGGLYVLIPIAVGILIKGIHGTGWYVFLLRCVLVGCITIVLDYFLILKKDERSRIVSILKK